MLDSDRILHDGHPDVNQLERSASSDLSFIKSHTWESVNSILPSFEKNPFNRRFSDPLHATLDRVSIRDAVTVTKRRRNPSMASVALDTSEAARSLL